MSSSSQTSWWGRNWKWVVPIGCLVPLLSCGCCVGSVLFTVFGAIKSSEPYADALARARANPQVQAALGNPIEAGLFPSGQLQTKTSNGVETGTVNLTIPISGPNGAGTIIVAGNKRGGQWDYSTLQVDIDSPPQTISLLRADE